MAFEKNRPRRSQPGRDKVRRCRPSGEMEKPFMGSLICSSTKKRPYGMKDIRKNILPILDGKCGKLYHSSIMIISLKDDA